MSNGDTWNMQDQRPPEKFWEDFGNFIKATLPYEDSDEYWAKLIRWADILQRRYHGNTLTGILIVDYLDLLDIWVKSDPKFPEYTGREIA